jgi:hypothetical protein
MAFEDSDRQFPRCLPHWLDNETQRSDCHIPFVTEHGIGFAGPVRVQN